MNVKRKKESGERNKSRFLKKLIMLREREKQVELQFAFEFVELVSIL